MPDKVMTEEDVVAELRDGMTIGIGGWGSRRKPMSLVRAILRSDLTELTLGSYAEAARDAEAWADFSARYLELDSEAAYREAVGIDRG